MVKLEARSMRPKKRYPVVKFRSEKGKSMIADDGHRSWSAWMP